MEELQKKVAAGCRIAAREGLAREIAGHVSARVAGSDEMWIRCRGAYERGLTFTEDIAVQRTNFDGDRPVGAEFELPLELPIHGEIYKARPDVNAVLHAHPTYAVMCAVAGIDLRPVYGAYDSNVLKLTGKGIPVYGRSRLINDAATAADLIAVLGESDVVIMRGHGITAVGRTVEEAVLNGVRIERLAFFNWQLALAGVERTPISDEDLEWFATPKRREVSRDTDWRFGSYAAEDELAEAARRHFEGSGRRETELG